ncbi:MAG TPA: hypothetical protein DCX03_06730 [Bacteroidales bacterium]|jgi:hypothetical protein|nr:hypothetical protein [Bacteroidales bacterium]HQQ03060.1 porin family protein [Bacteroidales bacterium]
MKHKSFLRLFFVLIISSSVLFSKELEAQAFRGILIGGFNLSQVDGDETYGFHKLGANIGAGVMLPFTRKWSVTLETLFSQKGSHQDAFYVDTLPTGDILTGEYDLRMNYVEVPLLIHFTDRETVSAGVGVSYGRLIGVTEKEHGKKVESTSLNNGPYKKDDWDIIGDIKLPLYKNLKINLRYSYSLAKIRTRDFYDRNGEYIKTRDQYHNLFSIRFLWVINEKSRTLQEQRAEQPIQ